jgi:carboxypeptidase C (cathepsin A)
VWRILHDADATPIWLAGESWGAGRAAEVGYQLEHRGIKVAGMMLISGGWALNEPPISKELHQALTLVDMASAAAFHGRTKLAPGEDLSAFRERVRKWAREVYAPALSRIDSISSSRRDSIAREVAGFSGLSLQSVDRKTLSVSPRQFRTSLLADKGKQAYLFDLRRTSAPPAAPAAEILSYFRQELKYPTDLPYLGDEDIEVGYAPNGNYPKPVGERWNYATVELPQAEIDAATAAAVANGGGPPRLGPPLPGSAEAIALDPGIHILVAGGLYDSFLPCATGTEIERSLPKNLKNSMAFRCYVGGHAMYFDAASRHDLARDVNALIEGRWPLPQ